LSSQRSPLDVKVPAQSAFSHADAQTHRLSNQQVSSYLSHVRKNKRNMPRKCESEDGVF